MTTRTQLMAADHIPNYLAYLGANSPELPVEKPFSKTWKTAILLAMHSIQTYQISHRFEIRGVRDFTTMPERMVWELMDLENSGETISRKDFIELGRRLEANLIYDRIINKTEYKVPYNTISEVK